uniref:ornithine decarboxylase n=1 Tax=Candidatus Kentrum sp. SD TaxID=2126332 RepID=A0A450YPM5_9GAMM|nr:MAG: ornithine decarboxylase [Candidatus Kentron sp. SD]VFK43494.1 MAG: ornithine decarboxylase [Candidatus Kentron sp. SD]VFK79572.1 MAG: ornithine decarboxylase [Candidatus Kentron sp. SD]
MKFSNPDPTKLVDEHGSPLVVISQRELTENLRYLQTALPNVRLHYAVKANPTPNLLRVLAEAGSGFDIASLGELDRILALGVPARDVIYTNPIKRHGEIESASQRGVDTFFYDNLSELDKIARAAPGARVILRLSVNNPDCIVDLGAKFGCAHDEAESLLKAALERNLILRGLGFHVGSQTSIPTPYLEMMVLCRDLFNKMALAGYPMDTLDIGGGFPVSYKTPMMELDNFCKLIRDAICGYFPDTEILAEPGRAICATAALLIMRVIGKSRRQGITWYYLDDGIYGTLSGIVFDKTNYGFHCIENKTPEPCVLAGPTCDSFDIIAKHEFMPALEIGDMVLVHNVGAYSVAHATRFNDAPAAKIVMVE